MNNFSSKQKGDIAEYRVISELLKRGYNVLAPCCDQLPYDLAIAIDSRLVRIQVKFAWFAPKTNHYVVDTRKSKTNRRHSFHTKYKATDFEFLIAWLSDLDVFYIMPAEFACEFSGPISMVERPSQRKARSYCYRDNWELIEMKVCDRNSNPVAISNGGGRKAAYLHGEVSGTSVH